MENESYSFFKELGGFLRPYRLYYIASIIIAILSVAATIASYLLVGIIAGSLISGDYQNTSLIYLALGALALKLGDAILLNASTWISHHAAFNTLMDIRIGLSDKMRRLPLGYFEANGSGRLKTLLVDRIEGMEKTLAHMIPELTSNLLAPLAFIIWMMVIDYRIGLAVMAWIFIGFGVSAGMMRGYKEKYAGQINALKGMNQAIVEYVNGIEVIKGFGIKNDKLSSLSRKVYDHASYDIGWSKESQIYTSLSMGISPFSTFIVLILGLIFYFNQSLAGGDLVILALLSLGIFQPLMKAMTYADNIAGMGTYAKEIRDVLDYKELNRGSLDRTDRIDIRLSNVSYSYDSNRLAIDDINLDIKEGEMVAICGESGSGKSTIAKLLAGYFDKSSGDIYIGDNKIEDYSQEYLNELIAYVDQDAYLFNISIMENIRLGRKDATDSEIIEASIKCGIDSFIRGLPNGYNTICGDGGLSLSGGERERITLARAMIKNAPIMLLDEPTASTDLENEYEILKSLLSVTKNKTLIVIAHRLYTIMKADKICVMNAGRIEAIGTHQELIEKSPTYKRLISKEVEVC